MKILMLYPKFPDTFWGFKHAVKFISKEVTNPPLGLITVAAMLPEDWEKRLVDLNIRAVTNQELEWADLVFISGMTVQRSSAHDLIKLCKEKGKTVIAGGPLFTGEFDHFPEVDHFVLNEAEITLPLFLTDLAAGSLQRIYTTEDYADLHTTPVPMWNLLNLGKYDAMSVQFSRGCPYNCDFCNVTALLGHRPRVKTAQQIIAELDGLYAIGWRRNVFFVDDNFIGNKKILKEEILPAIIAWRKGKLGFQFITEASVNLADDEELMELMVEAGFNCVFVGIETPDELSLVECHKTQNQKRDLVDTVKRLQRHGLQVMAGFIVGFDSDTPTIFKRQIDFIQKSGIVTAMVGLLQAPFGTQLYDRIKKEGRLSDEMSGDNADGSSNIIPKMDPKVLMAGYEEILNTIYSPKYFYERIRTFLLEFHPRRNPVTLQVVEILALFRSIVLLGILGPERNEYWRLIFWTLRNFPEKLPIAITLTIFGYHFRIVSEASKRAIDEKLAKINPKKKRIEGSSVPLVMPK